MEKLKLKLIIESEEGLLNGIVTHNDNLIMQVKHSSAAQAKKIENTIHHLAEQMIQVSLHASA